MWDVTAKELGVTVYLIVPCYDSLKRPISCVVLNGIRYLATLYTCTLYNYTIQMWIMGHFGVYFRGCLCPIFKGRKKGKSKRIKKSKLKIEGFWLFSLRNRGWRVEVNSPASCGLWFFVSSTIH